METYTRPYGNSSFYDSTEGCDGCSQFCYYVSVPQQHVIHALKKEMPSLDFNIRNQIILFCCQLSDALFHDQIDIELPEFDIQNGENDFFIGWIFDNLRFGYDFCDNAEKSGWFYIWDKNDTTYRFRNTFNGNYKTPIKTTIQIIKENNYARLP